MNGDRKMEAVIMAGGKGTRIAELKQGIPKPMISIAGKPVLEHQVEALRRQEIRHIYIVAGYLADVVCGYFGDGSRWDVSIEYEVEEEPLGTAGALYRFREKIKEDFLLLNGDIIFDIDINRMAAAHKKNGGIATIFTHPNDHPYDSALIEAGEDGRVTGWLHKEEGRLWYQNRVNAGIHMLSPEVFKHPALQHGRKADLDRDILKPLIGQGKLYAYDSTEYVKDMGTPGRYYEAEADIKSGKVAGGNYRKKQKAVFLDRDGTINKYVGFLTDISRFELEEGAAEAIRKINRAGYLAVVVTNQPVVARGEVTEGQLKEIHNKMETLLGEQGAYVDAIFYCPHHPGRGYPGEIPKLKMECSCRKPKPGLLYRAAEQYNIGLKDSWMVGDSDTDMQAGMAAGCHVAGIGNRITLEGAACKKNLLSAVDYILGKEREEE